MRFTKRRLTRAVVAGAALALGAGLVVGLPHLASADAVQDIVPDIVEEGAAAPEPDVFYDVSEIPPKNDQALATCRPPDGLSFYYVVDKGVRIWRATNVRSDYLKGPGTISYSKTKTMEVNASITATVSAEAGVIFAKASTSLGVTVGGSYSKSDTWTYSADVPKGKTARLVMYREGRQFRATKYVWSYSSCKFTVKWRITAKAPRKANVNLWKLQYL